MLEPTQRLLLLDALRPPVGFRFDEGIGTTFSLDLLTLLTAPLAFTLFDAQDPSQEQVAGSMEVLHSARQYASKLTVFCQASYVSVPKAILTQYAFLEGSIVECQGKRRGLFHPKVWLLRFVNTEGDRTYRLLCLSRNLTFANSWDTALLLEGKPTRQSQPRNRPLARFVASLPGFAVQEAAQSVRERAIRLSEEIDTVEFALPEGFSDLTFWPMGIDDLPVWPFGQPGSRLLVISPFATSGCLDRLATTTRECTLVSTRDELMKLRYRPEGFAGFRVLHDAAVAEFLDSEAADSEREAAQLNGLHAKCFVIERGGQAHVWTGSANATDAAFSTNVEFLTELVGPKRRFGLDAILVPEKDELTFGNLLVDAADLVATKTPDPSEEDLRHRVELARALLCEAGLRATAHAGDQDRWMVTISGELEEPLPEGLTVWCWPIAASGRRQRLGNARAISVTFPELSFDAISAFLVCRLEARVGSHAKECQFVLTLPLEGVPSDRIERIVRELVKDRAALMRFLFLLLSDEGEGLVVDGDKSDQSDGPWQWSHGLEQGLFELLVRALDQKPARLDEIAKLVSNLASDSRQEQVLPPGFIELWRTIVAARTEQPVV
jgi:hypothetical protein